MDIVSLVIGTNGLLSFAQVALDITKTIRDVQTFPEDMTDLLSRLSIETTKVRCWSFAAASLKLDQAENSRLSCRDQELLDLHRHMLQQCGTEVQAILTQIDRITQTYTVGPQTEQGTTDIACPTEGETAATPRSPSYAFRDGAQAFAAMMASPAVPNSSQAFRAKAWRIQSASLVRTLTKTKKIAAILKPWGHSDKKSLEDNLNRLRSCNDSVFSVFQLAEITLVKSQVRTLLIREFDQIQILKGIGRASKDDDPEISKSATLAIEVLDAAENQHCNCQKYEIQHSKLIMQDGDLGSAGILEDHAIVSTALENAGKSVSVFVEWLNYSGLDESQENIAKNRIHSLCHILGTEKPNSIQTLRFLGYVQNHEDKHIGIVSLVGDRNNHLVSLRQILNRDKTTTSCLYPRLALGQRFSLALQLCKVFLELHTARWLHRGFSSHCVLMQASRFYIQSNAATVCGFQYARPAGKAQVSLPLNHGDFPQRTWYLHPDIRYVSEGGLDSNGCRTRYETRHDIFSLGIVLLEIGIGKPIEKILEPSAEQFVETLRSRARSNLPFLMGQKYADIVDCCLTDRSGSMLTPEDRVGQDRNAQPLPDNDDIGGFTVMLDQLVLSLEECHGDKL